MDEEQVATLKQVEAPRSGRGARIDEELFIQKVAIDADRRPSIASFSHAPA